MKAHAAAVSFTAPIGELQLSLNSGHLALSPQGQRNAHQRTSNQVIPTLSESLGVWLTCRCEHGWPSHLVGSVAHEALSPFADRAMNAVDRIGRLALKHRRSA